MYNVHQNFKYFNQFRATSKAKHAIKLTNQVKYKQLAFFSSSVDFSSNTCNLKKNNSSCNDLYNVPRMHTLKGLACFTDHN